MSKMRLVSILLVIILIFTSIPFSVMASSSSDPVEVTLSMYSNLSDEQNISGLYKDNVFYIRVEDLCEISGAKIEKTKNNNVFLSLNQGMRNFEIITAGGGMMKENFYSDSYAITMPVIVQDNNVYISAIDFLHYIGAHYSLSKDGNPQFMVAIKYTIFDAMADLVNSDLGNFFWWDEVDYDGKSIENKIVNAGVVALINRDSNVFRMMFDAKGIEREALEDALISILTNEGASYFDENNKQLDFINLGNDVLGMESSIASFVVDFYKSDATDSFGKYLDGFASNSADAVNSITNLLNSIESVKQFESMTETQRTLLENTIISYSENSSTLNDGWENLLEAAKNVDTRAKDAYANKYAEALDFSQKTGYDMLKGSTGTNPVSIAWDGAILINKLIPYTSNMIDKKTQLYNAYNCSMIQLIANELLANAYSRLYYSNYCGQQSAHLDYLTQIKNSLILQLKSTLTTREYLIKSEFLTEDYANTMQVMNNETAELLNKAENCKVVPVGETAIYAGKEDYSWIANFKKPLQADNLTLENYDNVKLVYTNDLDLYFCSQENSNTENLYIYNLTNNKITLIEENVSYDSIQVDGEFIYYTKYTDTNGGFFFKRLNIATRKSENVNVVNNGIKISQKGVDNISFSSCYVKNEHFYSSLWANGNQYCYLIKFSSSNDVKIICDFMFPAANLTVYQNKLYFDGVNLNEDGVYSVSTNGGTYKTLYSGSAIVLDVCNDKVYFSTGSNSSGITDLNYVSINGGSVINLFANKASNIVICDAWVYYIDESDSHKIKRVNTSTKEVQTITNGECVDFIISKEKEMLYYQSKYSENAQILRISINDGIKKIDSEPKSIAINSQNILGTYKTENFDGNDEYCPKFVLSPNNAFNFEINNYEGMYTIKGKYVVENDVLTLIPDSNTNKLILGIMGSNNSNEIFKIILKSSGKDKFLFTNEYLGTSRYGDIFVKVE